MYFAVDHFCLVVYVCGIVFTSLRHPYCHVLAHPFQLFVLYVHYHFCDILVLSICSSSDLIWWLSTTTRLVSVWERYTHFRLVHTRLTHNFGFNTQNLFAQCVKCKQFEMVLLVHTQVFLLKYEGSGWVFFSRISFYIVSVRKHTSTRSQ